MNMNMNTQIANIVISNIESKHELPNTFVKLLREYSVDVSVHEIIEAAILKVDIPDEGMIEYMCNVNITKSADRFLFVLRNVSASDAENLQYETIPVAMMTADEVEAYGEFYTYAKKDILGLMKGNHLDAIESILDRDTDMVTTSQVHSAPDDIVAEFFNTHCVRDPKHIMRIKDIRQLYGKKLGVIVRDIKSSPSMSQYYRAKIQRGKRNEAMFAHSNIDNATLARNVLVGWRLKHVV
jgi:hypothetical protein